VTTTAGAAPPTKRLALAGDDERTRIGEDSFGGDRALPGEPIPYRTAALSPEMTFCCCFCSNGTCPRGSHSQSCEHRRQAKHVLLPHFRADPAAVPIVRLLGACQPTDWVPAPPELGGLRPFGRAGPRRRGPRAPKSVASTQVQPPLEAPSAEGPLAEWRERLVDLAGQREGLRRARCPWHNARLRRGPHARPRPLGFRATESPPPDAPPWRPVPRGSAGERPPAG
jgi:hypothetical protein